MSGHTPGPWHLMASYPGVTAGRDDIAIVEDGEALTSLRPGANGLAKRWANARLIAAAPELLEALQAIVASLSEHDDEGMVEHASKMISAREAIAKATGAQP